MTFLCDKTRRGDAALLYDFTPRNLAASVQYFFLVYYILHTVLRYGVLFVYISLRYQISFKSLLPGYQPWVYRP